MAEQDDERAIERAAILRRRAQLVACAIATGVAAGHGACSTCLSPIEPMQAAGAAAGSSLNACPSDESGNCGGAPAESSGGASAGSITFTPPAAGGESVGGGATDSAIGGEGGGGPTLCLSVK